VVTAFDIETGPLPEEQLRKLYRPTGKNFTQPPFNEADVKLGNIKDPEKQRAKIEEARQAHAENEVKLAESAVEWERIHWQGFVDSAALHAQTGRVLAIAFNECGSAHIDTLLADNTEESEHELLRLFWNRVMEIASQVDTLVGWNSNNFDIPFIMQRSWILGVRFPIGVFSNNFRFLHNCFVDLMQVWGCCQRSQFYKLDDVAVSLGLPGKLEGISGKDFHKLYFSERDEDRDLALSYLCQDVRLTAQVAEALGVA